MQRLRRGLLCAFVIVAAAIVLGMVFNLVVPAAGLLPAGSYAPGHVRGPGPLFAGTRPSWPPGAESMTVK